MNKKSKWLLVLSLATMVTGSGIVMAATSADQTQDPVAGKGCRPPMAHHMGHGKMDNTALLSLLNMDEQALRSEFAAGKTLGQIAGEHGVAEQAVIDLQTAQMIKHIEEGVQSGRLTAEQGEQMKAGAAERAAQMVKNGPGPRGHMGPQMRQGKKDNTALLALLNMDEQALRSEFAAGKTLGQIAGEHGVAEQAVIDLEKAQMIKHIEEGVQSGRLTAEQGEQMKAGAAERAAQMVKNGPGPRGHMGTHMGHGPMGK